MPSSTADTEEGLPTNSLSNGNSIGVSQDNGSVLLVETRPLFPKNEEHVFILTSKKLVCQRNDRNKDVFSAPVEDIVGCECLKGRKEEDISTYLTVYAYPHKKKLIGKGTERYRATLTICFNKWLSYEQNLKEGQRWRATILARANKILIPNIADVSNIELPAPKRLLVLVNPFSGPGKALQIFQQRVVPVLAEAQVFFNMLVTERAGHASDMVKSINLKEWHGILIVSGDGLIFEVVNGIMSRSDWKEAITTPIGCIPGGSGNALSCSLNYYAREPNTLLHCSFALAKHSVMPMDLVAVDTVAKRLYSFLSITWGLIADVDIESERYRNLGNARFTVGTIVRIMNTRKYHGKLSFLPHESFKSNKMKLRRSRTTSFGAASTGDVSREPPNRSESMMDFPGKRSSFGSQPNAETYQAGDFEAYQVDQEASQLQAELLEKTNGLQDVNGVLAVDQEDDGKSKLEKKSANNNDLGDIQEAGGDIPTKQSSTSTASINGNNDKESMNVPESSGSSNGSHSNSPDSESSSVKLVAPPLDKPVPEDWLTIEDDFIFVAAVYQSHLGPEANMIPHCTLDDGIIHLTMLRGNVSRSKLISFFLSLENGGHLGKPEFEVIPVKAFRLVPDSPPGNMVVDGELVDYGPIQAEIMPSVARVMMLKK